MTKHRMLGNQLGCQGILVGIQQKPTHILKFSGILITDLSGLQAEGKGNTIQWEGMKEN